MEINAARYVSARFGKQKGHHLQLKHPSRKSDAHCCNTFLASKDRLSSRVSPSAVRAFFPFCFFPKSSNAPVELFTACCRCRTSGWPKVDVAEDPVASSLSLPCFFLGFSVTAMVVPNRECREVALRAMFRLTRSSAASNLWRLAPGCYIRGHF